MTQFLNKSFSVAMPGNKGEWPFPDLLRRGIEPDNPVLGSSRTDSDLADQDDADIHEDSRTYLHPL